MKKELPQNIEAEKAVISSIIKASNQFQAIDDISRILNSDDFYRYPNREIYTAILFMFSEHKSIDEITLTEYLKNAGKLDKIGGIAYITEIGDFKEGNGEYVYFFTSVEKDYDVSEYAQAVNYKGQTLTSSGVGVSQMSVEEDAVIYIGKIKY